MTKFRLKTGDMVKLIAGKDKGKTGKILQVFPKLGRIVVEGANASKRHLRSRQREQHGQVVEFFMPIHVSNALPVLEGGKTIRHRKKPKTSSL